MAVLLCVTASLALVNDRYLRLQRDIGLLGLACGVAVLLRIVELLQPTGLVANLARLTQSLNLNETLLKGVLCFMLFRGSVAVRWASLREQRWLVLALAFLGTTIASLVTGWLTYRGLATAGVSLTLAQALLFGALIAATDPVAALAILDRIGLPANLETVLDGESLINDGVAVVLFTVFAAAAIDGVAPSSLEASAIFLREVVGGVALGLAGWLVIHLLLPRATDYPTGLLISLGAVAGLYAIALNLDVSGPIATVVAGLLTGNRTLHGLDARVHPPLRVFWNGLDDVLNALLFVFVGLHVVLIDPLTDVVVGAPALVAIAAVLAGRAVAVGMIVAGLDALGVIRAAVWRLSALLPWGGMRGGLSLALVLSLPESGWKPVLLNMTFAVVVFSIVVQGLTIDRLFDAPTLRRLLGHPSAGARRH